MLAARQWRSCYHLSLFSVAATDLDPDQLVLEPKNSHRSLAVTLRLPAIICQLTQETSSKDLFYSDDHDVIWMRLIKSLFFTYYSDFHVCDCFVSEIPLRHYEIQSNGAEVLAISSASKCHLTSTCQHLSSSCFNTFWKSSYFPKRVVKARSRQQHLRFQKEPDLFWRTEADSDFFRITIYRPISIYLFFTWT